MSAVSAQFIPSKDGNYLLGFQGLHFSVLFPFAAQAAIFIASVPKSIQVAQAFQSFAFDCFKSLVVVSAHAPHSITLRRRSSTAHLWNRFFSSGVSPRECCISLHVASGLWE